MTIENLQMLMEKERQEEKELRRKATEEEAALAAAMAEEEGGGETKRGILLNIYPAIDGRVRKFRMGGELLLLDRSRFSPSYMRWCICSLSVPVPHPHTAHN